MEKLTNIIEAILFASGKPVAVADIAEKLGLSEKEVRGALKELGKKFGEDEGIRLLEFNNKAQLATNPNFREQVSAVLNPIREKELTKTIMETAAIIAYKQPVTRSEIEILRGLNSDYAVNALLELKLIYPCGRKDAVGRPVLFATTDEFLKRFNLRSLDELPDYETMLDRLRGSDDRDTYLYAREEYDSGEDSPEPPTAERSSDEPKPAREEVRDGYEIPDFLKGLDDDDLLKIG